MAALLCGCDFEHYRASALTDSISVSPQEFTLERSGGGALTLEIRAAGDWIIIAPETLIVQPAYGSGDTSVTVLISDSRDPDTQAWLPRTDVLSVCGTSVTIPVTIRQRGNSTE